MFWLLYRILQNKAHYKRVAPFARSQKGQHKYNVCLDWILSRIINRGVGGGGGGIRMSWVEKNRKIKKLISKFWCCGFRHFWLVKVKVILQSFHLHLSRIVCFVTCLLTFQLFKGQLHKMVKYTQTIRRQIADELFECVWPFCGIGA